MSDGQGNELPVIADQLEDFWWVPSTHRFGDTLIGKERAFLAAVHSDKQWWVIRRIRKRARVVLGQNLDRFLALTDQYQELLDARIYVEPRSNGPFIARKDAPPPPDGLRALLLAARLIDEIRTHPALSSQLLEVQVHGLLFDADEEILGIAHRALAIDRLKGQLGAPAPRSGDRVNEVFELACGDIEKNLQDLHRWVSSILQRRITLDSIQDCLDDDRALIRADEVRHQIDRLSGYFAGDRLRTEGMTQQTESLREISSGLRAGHEFLSQTMRPQVRTTNHSGHPDGAGPTDK